MMISLGRVDKKSPVPLYYQIYTELKRSIDEEQFVEGDILYSEMALREHFGVSRVTVRNALDQLEREGYIERSAGRGTLVKDFRNTFRWGKPTSFTEELSRQGEALTSIVLRFDKEKPTKKMQHLLNLNEDEYVYCLQRIRLVNGVRVAMQTSYISPHIPVQLTAEMFDEHASLFGILSTAGLKAGNCDETIEAKIPTPEIKHLLEMDEESAVFYKERIAYDINEVPFEFSIIHHNALYYKYFVKNGLSFRHHREGPRAK